MLAAAEGLALTPLVIGEDGAALSVSESAALLGVPVPEPHGRVALPPSDGRSLPRTLASLQPEFDAAFPLLHGPYGEDGRVQGLLDVLGFPYVGSGVHGSAVAMDKLTMKAVFAAHGLPQVAFRAVARAEHSAQPEAAQLIGAELGFPLFVKPANLGSSIGISRVTSVHQLGGALDEAFAHGHRVIAEAAVERPREIEVAVLGNDSPAVSPVGEIRHANVFYDYETKYTDGLAELLVPADVPAEVARRAQELAVRAFKAVDARGLARVDFFYLERSGELLLNEINTMPGFTRHSMYPRLWGAGGVSFGALVRRLVELALEAP